MYFLRFFVRCSKTANKAYFYSGCFKIPAMDYKQTFFILIYKYLSHCFSLCKVL
jgi:hypothetical protein